MTSDGVEGVQFIGTTVDSAGIDMSTKYVLSTSIASVPTDATAVSPLEDVSGSVIGVSEDQFNSNSTIAVDASSPDARCLVCNDKASGLHYGVLACEGCKVGAPISNMAAPLWN